MAADGKVLVLTKDFVGGGSGICRGMTEGMMRHGAKAAIVGRKYVSVKSLNANLPFTQRVLQP